MDIKDMWKRVEKLLVRKKDISQVNSVHLLWYLDKKLKMTN
jgi:hypothetical protein